MSFWSRLFKNSTLSQPEQWLVSALGTGEMIDEETALKVCACYACVSIIADQIALLPLNVYQKTESGGRKKRSDTNLHRILNEAPNPYMTAFTFWRAMLYNLTICGAAHAEIQRDPRSREPVYLWPIPQKLVQKKRHPNGEPYWIVRVPIGEGLYETKMIPYGNMLELPGLTPDGYTAYKPLSLLAGALKLSRETEKYSTEYFSNGSHPSGVIEYPGKLKGQNLEDYKNNVKAAYTGLGNRHRVMLLEEGMKFNRISAPPDEGQMFESRKFQVIEVARFFKMPPTKLMDLERATYSNMEEANAQFADDTLMPYLINIRQEVTKDLLFDFQKQQGFYVEHDLNSLMKGKLLDRYNAYQIARRNGWLNVNEIRAKENMDNIGPNGDIYHSSGDLLPLGEVKE